MLFRSVASPAGAHEPAQAGAVFLPEEGGSGELEFSFSDETEAAPGAESPSVVAAFPEEMPGAARPKKAKKPKRKKIMGLTPVQLGIVIVLLLCWLCGLLAFAGYYFYSIGWIQFA